MSINITAQSAAELRNVIRRRMLFAERHLERLRSLAADVDAVERLIQFLEIDDEVVAPERPPATFSGRNPFRAGCNAAFIWEALDYAPDPWLTTAQVQMLASNIKGSEIPMSSVRPTLTDMKRTHVIRDGARVALFDRVERSPQATVTSPSDPDVSLSQLACLDALT